MRDRGPQRRGQDAAGDEMSGDRTVLVIGATGHLGRHVVAGLLQHGARVKALVRHPPTAMLPGEVSVVQGELERPDTVATAAEGADAAFLARRELAAIGGDEFAERALAYWGTLVDEPERATDDVERLTGHPARTFAQWARDHVDDFAATRTSG
jgi:NAD(P)-dependent dehydrogenase (short-subunit alcohol dehydrogenase family)